MRKRFISGLLVTLSVTSLALLRLQDWISAGVGSQGAMDLPDMDSRFGGWGYYAWQEMMQVSLVLTLALTAMVALFSLRLAKVERMPGYAPDGMTAVADWPATKLQDKRPELRDEVLV